MGVYYICLQLKSTYCHNYLRKKRWVCERLLYLFSVFLRSNVVDFLFIALCFNFFEFFCFFLFVVVFLFLSSRRSKHGCLHCSQVLYDAKCNHVSVCLAVMNIYWFTKYAHSVWAFSLPCFLFTLRCWAFSRWGPPSKPSIDLTTAQTHHCFSLNIVTFWR